ncbi:MAG: zinc-ribbon domain-containing protein, partial [bacterium]
MICPECNLLIPEDSRFCKECGYKLEASVEEREALSNQEKAEKLYREGIVLYHQGQFDEAIALWDEVNSLIKDFQMTDYYRGIAYYDKGMLSMSVECFKKAEASHPTVTAVHYRLGLAYYAMGLLSDSEYHFKKVESLIPDTAQIHYRLGLLYQKNA